MTNQDKLGKQILKQELMIRDRELTSHDNVGQVVKGNDEGKCSC